MPLPNAAEQIADIRRRRGEPRATSGRPQPTTSSRPGKKKGKRKPNYRERLANPGQRATIPDDVLRRLDPKLYQRRAQNKRYAEPFTEGSPLTYGEVVKERSAAEGLQFGPQEEALRQRLGALDRGSSMQQSNITNWFDQYKNDLNTAKQAQAAQYQGAIGQVTGGIAASQGAADASRSQMDAETRADAERRGQTYSGAPGAQAAQGNEARRGLQDQLVGLLAASGAAQDAYLSARQGVGSAAQLTERLRESNRYGQEKDEISGDKQQLERERGEFRTSYMADRREKERTYGLERAAFGLDKAKAEQDAADETADNAEQRRAARAREREQAKSRRSQSRNQARNRATTRRGQDISRENAQDRIDAQRERDRQRNRDLSPSERRAENRRVQGVREKSGKVEQDVESAKELLDTPGRPRGPQVRQQLISGQNPNKKKYDPAVVDAASELSNRGYISNATAKRLHRLGVRVPRSWLPPRNRGAERQGQQGRGGEGAGK